MEGNATEILQRKYFDRAKKHLESIEDELAEKSTYNFYIGKNLFLHHAFFS